MLSLVKYSVDFDSYFVLILDFSLNYYQFFSLIK